MEEINLMSSITSSQGNGKLKNNPSLIGITIADSITFNDLKENLFHNEKMQNSM